MKNIYLVNKFPNIFSERTTILTEGTIKIGEPYVVLDSTPTEAIISIHIPMDYEIID